MLISSTLLSNLRRREPTVSSAFNTRVSKSSGWRESRSSKLRTIGSLPSLPMIASPSTPDSKTSSMILSRPVPWTSIRSCTSSPAATFEPGPGVWSSSPTRVPSCRSFCWNSFSLATSLPLELDRTRTQLPMKQTNEFQALPSRSLDNLVDSSVAVALRLQAEHWRMMRLKHLSVAKIHMHTAWQAGVEAPDCAHDVNALEFVGAVSSKIGVFWTASSYGPGVP